MKLNSIKLINFKSHQESSYDFNTLFTCFVGLNGKGKTNILDAIYFLCVTKSRFNAADAQLIRHGESFFRLEATFDRDVLLVAKYQKGKKTFEENKVALPKIADHFGKYPVVLACPDDILLMIGGSEERRKFFDYTLSSFDQNYFRDLMQYHHFLDQKNALLKRSSRNEIDMDLLQLYNAQLVAFGIPIYQKRKKSIELLSSFINEFYGRIAEDKEQIVIQYDSDVKEDAFLSQLESSFEREIVLQRSVIGVHRDDLLFLTNDFVTKKFASQGQQKTFLYALRLAQYKMMLHAKNIKPILLIDDIFDKLDAERSNNLLHVLHDKNLFEQVFITDTDKIKLEKYLAHNDYTIIELT